jgi:hypothetical protein
MKELFYLLMVFTSAWQVPLLRGPFLLAQPVPKDIWGTLDRHSSTASRHNLVLGRSRSPKN